MINLAVVGRFLKSPKWATLFEILDQGAEGEYWKYETFDVDKFDKKDFETKAFDHHILVGTKVINENIPSIRFYSTATEDEIIEKMQAFADSIFGDEDGTYSADTFHYPSDGNETDKLVCESSSVPDNVFDNGAVHDSPSPDSDISSTDISDNGQRFDSLVGLTVEVNDQTLLLSYEDAIQLKEMLSIMKEYGYKIKNVIVS